MSEHTGLLAYKWGLSSFSVCLIWLNENFLSRAYFSGLHAVFLLLSVLVVLSCKSVADWSFSFMILAAIH